MHCFQAWLYFIPWLVTLGLLAGIIRYCGELKRWAREE